MSHLPIDTPLQLVDALQRNCSLHQFECRPEPVLVGEQAKRTQAYFLRNQALTVVRALARWSPERLVIPTSIAAPDGSASSPQTSISMVQLMLIALLAVAETIGPRF
jgi:hypothetical protein